MCKAINFKTEMFLLTQKMPELTSISLHGNSFRKKKAKINTPEILVILVEKLCVFLIKLLFI